MDSKKKINLNKLNVQSFVTESSDNFTQTIKGGGNGTSAAGKLCPINSVYSLCGTTNDRNETLSPICIVDTLFICE